MSCLSTLAVITYHNRYIFKEIFNSYLFFIHSSGFSGYNWQWFRDPIPFLNTMTYKKIRTFCVLEDKFNVQLKGFQNMCQLLLDVTGGSYEHANRFTSPMSIQFSVEHSYITCSVQGGQNPPCAILFGNDLRVGLHIFVLSILKLQNAKRQEKICDFLLIAIIKPRFIF